MADVLTPDNELLYYSFPISKQEETADGDVLIWGKATDGTLDNDLQIVDPEWSAKALREWFDTGANVRVQHQAQRDPAGVGVYIETDPEGGTWVKSLIVEPVAKELVRKKVLKDYSIGIMHPDIRLGDPRFQHLDPAGKAVNGVITGRQDGLSKIGELTVCDRGSNFDSRFQLAKAAGADGSVEFTGKMIGADDTVTKDSGPDEETLAKAAKRFSPGDLAKILAIRARAEEAEVAKKAQPGADEEGGENVSEEQEDDNDGDDADAGTAGKATAEPDTTVVAEPDEVKAAADEALKAVMVAETGVYKRDIDTATRKRLAGEGRALSNLSYPIETHEDADNAVTLALSGHGDVSAAKSLIRRIAAKEGWQDILDRLSGKKDGAGKAAKPKVPCPGCGTLGKSAARFCVSCGTAMAAAKSASPGDGVTGEHTEPVPAHREPDGAAMEMLEEDAGMADGDEAAAIANEAKTGPPAAGHAMSGKAAMDAVLRHRTAGAPDDDAVLHDLLCPAFDPADTAKCFEGVTVASALDPAAWQDKALEAAANAPLDKAASIGALWDQAIALKAADPAEVADVRAELHAAFLAANKSTDAKPGPTTFPTPTELSPTRFRRPYVSAGHAASPQPDGSHQVTIPAGQHAAGEYQRGPVTAGHEAPSPGSPASPSPVPSPGVTGKPERVFYRNTRLEAARHAMSVLHDHIAEVHPDLCPMHGPGYGGEPPSGARTAPDAQGAPGARKAADGVVLRPVILDEALILDETMKAAAKPAVKPGKVPCPKCGKSNKPKAQFCGKCGGKMGASKAAAVTGQSVVALTAPEPAADPEVIKAAVAEAVAPYLEQLAKMQADIDEMGSEGDPRYAPFKAVAQGGVLPKMAAEDSRDQVTKAADAQRAIFFAEMQQQMYSGDPNIREPAWAAYNEMVKAAGTPPAP